MKKKFDLHPLFNGRITRRQRRGPGELTDFGRSALKRNISWLMQGLALAHYLWAAILFVFAAWWIFSALSVMTHMSSGTFAGQLLISVSLALAYGAPPALLGRWMLILGNRIRRSASGLRQNLLITHGLLLMPGIVLTILGNHAVKAAARSTSHGGGLLSPVAVIPLAVGAAMVLLSALSIAVALIKLPRRSED